MPKTMRKRIVNQLKTEFRAVSENERLSRAIVCAMIAQMDVTVEELADVRCAISEAVTNAVVHAYRGQESPRNTVYIMITLYDDRSTKIIIRDRGCGIPDIRRAMEPLYTTDDTGERSGMGFAIMQSFMDKVKVKSAHGKGTTVELRKTFSAALSAQTAAAETQAVPTTEKSTDGREGIA